jgi:hypothetical protein
MNGNTFRGDFNHLIRAKKFQYGIQNAQDILDEVIESENI